MPGFFKIIVISMVSFVFCTDFSKLQVMKLLVVMEGWSALLKFLVCLFVVMDGSE